MDFVSDILFDSRRLRALTMIDNFTRESPAIEVDQGITGQQVVQVLEQVSEKRGLPDRVFLDKGPEFVSKALDLSAYEHGVTLDFSRPGKPTDNPFIESFNGRLREECLNENWFVSVVDAQDKLETWRLDYNKYRPHSSLGNMTPEAYAKQVESAPCVASPRAPSPRKQTWKSLIPPGPETGSTSREIFYTLRGSQVLIENWRVEYNTLRHMSLGCQPPAPEAILPRGGRDISPGPLNPKNKEA